MNKGKYRGKGKKLSQKGKNSLKPTLFRMKKMTLVICH